MKKFLLSGIALLALCNGALAQAQLPPGTIWGNPTTALALPRAARPNLFGLTEVNNVKKTPFNAVCDGIANDTTAIQAALTAAITNRAPVLIPADGVCLSGPLVITSGVTLMGDGPTSTLRAHPTLIAAPGAYLVVNQNTGSYIDNHITIRDLTIDGNNVGAGGTQSVFHGLIGMGRVTDFHMDNVKIYNYQYIGLEAPSSIRMRITNSEFTALGYSGDVSVSGEAGAAIYNSSPSTDYSIDTQITNNFFHDLNWAALYILQDTLVSTNTFVNIKEATLITPYIPPATAISKNIIVSNNVINGVTQHFISASCIESEGWQVSYIGNRITNCGHNGIVISDTHDNVIVGNTISNFGQVGGGNYAGVAVTSRAVTTARPQGNSIHGNRIFDDQTPVTGFTCIAYNYTSGGSTPAINETVTDNNCAGTVWVSGSSFVEGTAGIFGAGSIRRNNQPATMNLALPVAEGGTGCLTATGSCLDNITGFTGIGLIARAGGGVYRASTIVGTANEIAVANGTGATADPTLSLPAALTFTGKTITGGTFASPTFSGTIAGFPATTCTNQFVSAVSAAAVVTCTTDTLASAQHANQGTVNSVLHGNAAGNPSWSAVALADHATQATNTVVGNATAGTAVPTALAVGSCSTAASALNWTTNTGFGCNTSITANAVAVGGITGLGTGVGTWLATPSSANLAAALTDEVGTGSALFGASGTWTPTFIGSTTAGTGQTYSTQVGVYERVGNAYRVRFRLTATSLGTAAGNLLIGGLPATSSSTANFWGTCSFPFYTVAGLAANNAGMGGYITPGTTQVTVTSYSIVSTPQVTVTQAGGTADIMGWCTFPI